MISRPSDSISATLVSSSSSPALIAVVAVAHYGFGLNAVLAFWMAYILTRPLGASIGDYLSQPRSDGGLGLGTTITSAIFLERDRGRRRLPHLHPDGRDRDRYQPDTATADVLVVAHEAAATPALLEAIRARASDSAARFHLLIPNTSEHAELTDADREHRHRDGERKLAEALPLVQAAAGGAATGAVSFRHDPMDAIEEALHAGGFHEIIVSTLPHHLSHWLHVDLPQRLGHLGLPVTTVISEPI